jgi:hypothetical protein
MKKLRKVLLPVAIILIGAGAAFATNAVKSTDEPVDGYYFDNTSKKCITPKQCDNVEGNTCTWVDASGSIHNLCRRTSETMCTVRLAKLPD